MSTLRSILLLGVIALSILPSVCFGEESAASSNDVRWILLGWLILSSVVVGAGFINAKFYSMVEFLSLHSKSVTPWAYHLVLKGRDNKPIRFIALILASPFVVGIIAMILALVGLVLTIIFKNL